MTHPTTSTPSSPEHDPGATPPESDPIPVESPPITPPPVEPGENQPLVDTSVDG